MDKSCGGPKAVNNAIDKKTVAAVAGWRAGQSTRLLELRALISLTLERRLADRFVPELRRELFEALAVAKRTSVSLEGGFLRIDLREPRRELRRARRLVVSDPGIMGCDPVFRGTRVPVHLVAAMMEQGDTIEGIMGGYPRLTSEMIWLAPVYAAA